MFKYQIDNNLALALPIPNHDAKPLFNLINSHRAWYKKWLPWVDFIKDVKSEKSYLQKSLLEFAMGKSLNLIIRYKNQVAGMISFNGFRSLDHSADIGYWLGLPFQHKGIVTYAVKGISRIGFNDYDLNKVIINASVDNQASNNVAKRCGFHKDGTLRENELLNGIYHDENRYSLLESEVNK